MREACFLALSRWPAQVSATEHVHVEMIDALAGVGAGVDHDAIALVQPLGAGDFGGREHQPAENLLVLAAGVRDGGDVLAGNNEEVHGRLRIDIGKRVAVLIAMHGFRQDLSFDNLAEQAIHRLQFTG